MSQATFFIKEVTSEIQIQEIEKLINQMEGVERALIGTNDGEVKIEFNNRIVSKEEIIAMLANNNYKI